MVVEPLGVGDETATRAAPPPRRHQPAARPRARAGVRLHRVHERSVAVERKSRLAQELVDGRSTPRAASQCVRILPRAPREHHRRLHSQTSERRFDPRILPALLTPGRRGTARRARLRRALAPVGRSARGRRARRARFERPGARRTALAAAARGADAGDSFGFARPRRGRACPFTRARRPAPRGAASPPAGRVERRMSSPERHRDIRRAHAHAHAARSRRRRRLASAKTFRVLVRFFRFVNLERRLSRRRDRDAGGARRCEGSGRKTPWRECAHHRSSGNFQLHGRGTPERAGGPRGGRPMRPSGRVRARARTRRARDAAVRARARARRARASRGCDGGLWTETRAPTWRCGKDTPDTLSF